MPEVKWTREVSLLTNYYIVMDVLFVILFGGAGLGFILFLIMGAAEIYVILQIITLATGILIVLAFLTMGIVMLNNVEMTFTLDEKGIKTVLGKGEQDKQDRPVLWNAHRETWLDGHISTGDVTGADLC